MSKSMPYLKRAPHGVWYVHWTENRIGKRASTSTKEEAQARLYLAQWLITEGASPTEETLGSKLTLADTWSVYYEMHVLKNVASVYTVDLAWLQLKPYFGEMPVVELSQMAIDEYIAKRTSGRLGRKVKPQTTAKELAYLLASVNFCADPRRKVIDPSFVQKFDLPAPGDPRTRWLRHDEIQKMLDAAARLRNGSRLSRGERFLWLALETAGRKEALLDLAWSRVDFETGMIELDVPGRKKTKKRRANVPISAALRPVLERAHAERLDKKHDCLVLDNKGAIWPQIQRIAIEAGLGGDQKKPAPGTKPKATGISPHTLRHTAATHMARRGVSLFKIAKILGNTIAMVEKVYAKYQPEDLREAVDQISGGVLDAAE